jgi:hypothetical protein
MADVDALEAPIVHKLASRFLALTAVRLAALRGGRWDEIEGVDFSVARKRRQLKTGPRPLWRIPPARMKLTKVRKADPAAEHIVPCRARPSTSCMILHADRRRRAPLPRPAPRPADRRGRDRRALRRRRLCRPACSARLAGELLDDPQRRKFPEDRR